MDSPPPSSRISTAMKSIQPIGYRATPPATAPATAGCGTGILPDDVGETKPDPGFRPRSLPHVRRRAPGGAAHPPGAGADRLRHRLRHLPGAGQARHLDLLPPAGDGADPPR